MHSRIVAGKTGGTSGASAEAILESEKMIDVHGITVLVVSAAGSRFKGDVKVTDLLYGVRDKALREQNLAEVKSRHLRLVNGLSLSSESRAEIGVQHQRLEATTAKLDDGSVRIDDVVYHGEDIMARIRAARRGWKYRSAAGLIILDENGNWDRDACEREFERNPVEPGTVLGGFFGSLPNGSIQLMPRGWSDTSGSIVARFIGAKEYVIGTDVDGFFTADPNTFEAAVLQPSLLHSEARCLADGGAQVVNVDALYPLVGTGILVRVVNSRKPDAPGTMLVEYESSLKRDLNYIVGTSGYERCTYIRVRKSGANRSIGFTELLSSIFARHKVNVSHWGDDVDVLGPVIRHADLVGVDLQALFDEIRKVLNPEAFEPHENVSLLRVVFDRRVPKTKTIIDVLGVLSHEEIDFWSLTSTEQCMNLVIDQGNYRKAVLAIHDMFFSPERSDLIKRRLSDMLIAQSRPA